MDCTELKPRYTEDVVRAIESIEVSGFTAAGASMGSLEQTKKSVLKYFDDTLAAKNVKEPKPTIFNFIQKNLRPFGITLLVLSLVTLLALIVFGSFVTLGAAASTAFVVGSGVAAGAYVTGYIALLVSVCLPKGDFTIRKDRRQRKINNALSNLNIKYIEYNSYSQGVVGSFAEKFKETE